MTESRTHKRQAFLETYLKSWNATQAAKEAGYAHPRQAGSRMLSNVDIQAAIQARLDELKMSADEVLLRLADQARSSLADFVHLAEDGQIKISLAKADKLHLIRKISLTAEGGLQIELYDSQSALKLIGQHHRLFGTRNENLNFDFSKLTDEQLQQIKAGADPWDVILSTAGGGGA